MVALTGGTDFFDGARSWLDESVPDRWRKNRGALSEEEKISIRSEWDKQLFAGGYSGLSIPKEFGGQGLGLLEEVLFHELAARVHAPEGIGRIGKILTVPTLIEHGSEFQKAKYIPGIMSGTDIWCQAFSEPGAGSDLASVGTFAKRVDGGYTVTGQKTWTSFAQYSERAILVAKTSMDAPRYKNLSYFLLDMNQPGITFRTIRQISDTSHFAEVFLDDAFIADEDLVGEEGEGWKIAMTTLTAERGGVEAITRYVDIRGDVDILLSCCAVLHPDIKAAEQLDLETELIRWQVMKALDFVDNSQEFFQRTCMLKIMWSEIWQKVTSLGMKLGCLEHQDHWLNQYLETRAMSIYSGTNEIQRNIIGDRVLGLPR